MAGFFVVRARQYSLLWKDGIRCTGTVISKFTHQPKIDKPIDYYISYIYTCPNSKEYKNQSIICEELYEQLEENSMIDLVISASKPWICAPAYLIL
jgi:hypothetical protein